tara:strand:- start:18 stop:578 length:561 start_codon:yes stop_codon:yes gene_type:complete
MGIPTLIKTQTASNSASLDFVDGTSDVVLDSTYDEYMFVFTDINPATDNVDFSFQVNATDDAGGDYDTSVITSTYFDAYHDEADSFAAMGYETSHDLAQSATFQNLAHGQGNGADESSAGILHIFNPSSTTYVKHFYARFHGHWQGDVAQDIFAAGYINDTTAIDEIQFKMSSGNFDGVIQLYGIA